MRRRDFVKAGLGLSVSLPVRSWSAVLGSPGSIPSRTLEGSDVSLSAASVMDLAAGLRGDVLLSGGPGYDSARRIWNGMFDKRPALITRCTGASDVRRALMFAREHRLLTAVRAGGHSVSGKSTCDGGIMIDLQPMRGVRVDPATRRAYVEAGSLLGQLDHESQAHGLATTAGTFSITGAAGLTLGGGFGRLGRRFGLACDNVASFDVVTTDGRFLKASDEENADLFWGLRGGGGNFGVVTSIEYRLHPVNPMVLGGHVIWPLEQGRGAARLCRDMAIDAPDAANLSPFLYWAGTTAHFGVGVCWSGDHAEGERWLEPLRAFGRPVTDAVRPMRYVDIQSADDADYPDGIHSYAKNGFVGELTNDNIDLIFDVFLRTPGLYTMFLDHCGGAYARVAQDATAFPRRDMQFILAMWSGWKSSDGLDEKVSKMRAAWRELEPITGGFYVNYAGTDNVASRDRENYGTNFERLVALKAKYDPMNLLRLNANVPPKL
ncbi:MAG: FAD-binding oxidoreductase [Betaproteobacteria bacterium]|nr:MAG: FAD-binding oxidoreductase [Betaproteobacteria bacterium]